MVDQAKYHYISSYALFSGITPYSGSWTSSDPSVVAIGDQNSTFCQIIGISPGSTTVTGVISFQVETRAGVKIMTDTVSFSVSVNPPYN